MSDASVDPTTDPDGATGARQTGDERFGDIAALSYEAARDELVDIVRRLEAGAALEESLSLWERGERLAQHCETKLDHARERIENQRDGRAAEAESAGPHAG